MESLANQASSQEFTDVDADTYFKELKQLQDNVQELTRQSEAIKHRRLGD